MTHRIMKYDKNQWLGIFESGFSEKLQYGIL